MGFCAKAHPSLDTRNTVNDTLPIAAFRDIVLNSVRDNQVTVLTAETGAGKSTQVPQFLRDEGYTVIVTEPRRLAARLVAERVAEERELEIGREIGYRTGKESCESEETKCLFATDGLAMIRELVGLNFADVLVIDEVHEWNLNIEVLVAWVRREIANGSNLKVILMSATIEAEKLSIYFNDAPIVKVPGRLYPVETLTPTSSSYAVHAAQLAEQGRNVLVFVSGKDEISKTIQFLKDMGVNAEILPLHGELDASEQKKCFKSYPRPKIVVSTNIAQTSVTIPDIDAVVDSGLEKRIETVNGVEGLYEQPISLSDSEQRKGRAGRTKPGLYVDYCPESERPDFPVAEILRLRLDQVVLRLAEAGFDAEKLEFFHQPDLVKIHEAKETLKALGCLTRTESVTAIGREVSRLPLSVRSGRMVVEALHRGVVQDVITIAAILESGELSIRQNYNWRMLVQGENQSDLFAQLKLYWAARKMNKQQMEDNGIHPKAFFRALEMRKHLSDALRGKINWMETSSDGNREDIVCCIISGLIDHIFVNRAGGYSNGEKSFRMLSRESVVRYGTPIIVGVPRDIPIKKHYGTVTLNLVTMATAVSVELLQEIAPHLMDEVTKDIVYDETLGEVVEVKAIMFRGSAIGERRVLAPNTEGSYGIISRGLFQKFVADTFSWPRRALGLASETETGKVPLIEHVFAHHPRDGKPLKAFCTLKLEGFYSYYPVVVWTLDYEEAKRMQAVVTDHVNKTCRPIPSAQRETPRHIAPRTQSLSPSGSSGIATIGDILDSKFRKRK